MAIKRVLLPVGGDGSFDPLADMAFFVGEIFCSGHGLICSAARIGGAGVRWRCDPGEGAYCSSRPRKRRGGKQPRERNPCSRLVAGRFPHIESTFCSLTGDVETLFVRNGRLADISVIAPQDPFEDGFWGSSYWLDVQNATLFRCGRPVLLVPPHAPKLNFETVAIAWKESLEAARAIAAAQPFMARAREVHLFTIDDGGEAVTSLREAEEYLSLHYDEVRSEVLTGKSHQIGKLLLAQANRLGALLVMGAFSHWRWQERLLGGVTDYVLREASTPVLMMH